MKRRQPRPATRLRTMLLGLLAVAALLALGLDPASAADPASGQEPDQAPAAEAPPPPDPVAMERVATAAVDLERRLRTMLADAPSEARVQELEADLAEFQERGGGMVTAAQHSLDSGASVVILRARRVMLTAADDRLADWSRELDRGASIIAEALSELKAADTVWELTEKATTADEAGSGVERRVAVTRQAIKDVTVQLRERRDHILELREQLLVMDSAVDRASIAVELALEGGLFLSLERRNMVLGSRPFRDALAEELAQPSRIADRAGLSSRYLRDEATSVGQVLAVFVALCVSFTIGRRLARQRSKEEYGLDEAEEVWERPVAMAWLLTVLLLPVLMPPPPTLVWAVSSTSGFLAAVWILRGITSDRFDSGLNALAGLFLIDVLRHLGEPVPTLGRILYVIELFLTLILVFWLTRPARLDLLSPSDAEDPRFKLVGRVSRLAMILLGAALAFDVVGWHTTSELIGGGVLRGIYLGAVLYAATRVVMSVATYALSGHGLQPFKSVRRHGPKLRRRANTLISWLGIFSWLYLTLDAFGLRGPLRGLAAEVLDAGIEVGKVAISLGDVLLFGATVVGAFYTARFIAFLLDEEVFSRVQLPRGVPYALSSLARYVVLLVGFLFALAASGFPLDRVALLAGGLGVGIGFGLQNVVNNFVSGLILLFERPIQVGDSVQLATESLFGQIKRIGMRASVLRTWNGSEVIVPNGELVSGAVTNWTLSDRHRRMELNVGVEYGTNPHRVIELLLAVPPDVDQVLTDPAPMAFFIGFGDSSLDFLLRFWVRDFDAGWESHSKIALGVHDALADAGIGIPFPQRDLHLKTIPGG